MTVESPVKPTETSRRVPLMALVKWSLMLVAIFWTLVWTAAHESGGVPEFVYVNF